MPRNKYEIEEERLEVEKKKLKALESIAHATLYLYNWFEEIDKVELKNQMEEFTNYIKRIR